MSKTPKTDPAQNAEENGSALAGAEQGEAVGQKPQCQT